MKYITDANDPTNQDKLLCEYQYEGKTYRFHYRTILEMSIILHELPAPIRELIVSWCKMIHNPD